jgi:urocanate hydratase
MVILIILNRMIGKKWYRRITIRTNDSRLYMYIGPQGIVHGTTITVLNAFRKINRSPSGGLFLLQG